VNRTGRVIKRLGDPIFDDLFADKPWWQIAEEVEFTHFSVEVSGRLILTDNGWEIDEKGIDTLGLSADVMRHASGFLEAGEHDKAWRTLMEHQFIPLNDPEYQRYWLPYVHHKVCADILRREKKHPQALVHMIAFVIAERALTDRRLAIPEAAAFGVKEAASKYAYLNDRIRIYFGRCKFKKVDLADAMSFVDSLRFPPDFREIQEQVSRWANEVSA